MPDYAGNNLTSAREISFAISSQAFSDRVDTFDTDDYYRINLSGRSSLNLAVNGLSANANLQLLDRNGNTLQSSTNSAGIAESLNLVLDANTYYIRVYQDSSSASTDYTLNLQLQNSPKTDILWRDYSSGTNAVWFMGGTNNTTITASSYLTSVATNWHLEGTADFNGDNRPDLLWRDYSSGANAVWFMGGTNNTTITASSYLTSVATNWHLEGTADFNGDNRPDLLWRDYSSGANAVWFMGGTNNTTITASSYLTSVATNWHLEGTADFNGDNRPDLLWRDYSSGANAVWFMGGTNNTTITASSYLTSVATNWHLEGTADFNGDNRPDLLWRDYSSGANAVWFMGGTNNATIASSTYLTSVGTNWQALPYTRYEEPLPIDLAGNTTTTAFNLGTLSGSGTFGDRIDSADPNDYYQFTLASTSTVNLSLNGLSADADIQLLNSSGTVIQGSYASGNSAESIGSALSAGTYYVRVYQASGSTNYSLSLSATTAQMYKYNFTYFYNGSNTNADYYTGYVYDYAGKYSVNTFYNPNTALNQAGYDGKYYITGSSLVTGTANPGYVYASNYYDVDSSGLSYAAYYGNLGSTYASGYSGLGSEYDYVYDASRGAYDDFGNDNLEVDSLPVITLTTSDANAAETLSGQTANPGQFTFTRTGSNTSALTVYYTTGGSATNGSDYTSLATSVTFQSGQSSVTLPLNIVDDSLFEGNETVVLTLNANSAYTLGSATAGTVTIVDNDLPVITLTASDANAAETLTGQTANPGQFTFTRTGSNMSALTAYYTTGGSATNGSDYTSLATSVTFQSGQSSVTLPLNILDDSLVEGNETVVLTLNANSAYTLGSTTAGTVTIVDNDLPVITLTASDANAAEVLSGQTANPGQFTIARTGSTATALTVNYSVGGTATSGSDYSGVATSVTIAAGQSSAIIPINIFDDALIEGDETVNFVLLTNSAYGLGSNTSATVTIADNDAIYKYSFTYYYNGSSTSADYYTGYVYANSGTYTVGSYFDYTTNNNQAGYNGKYYINNFSIAGSSSDRGKVYATTYYDVDSSGNSYSAYYGNLSGYASGSNGLGTESDYIYDGSTYRGFGSDRDEVDVPRGSVTVTSPNGGNVLRPGSSQTITWSDNLTENVKIDLYKGGNFYATIAASVLSNDSYTWTLPTSLSNGNDYSIRITSVNNSSLYDSSDTTFSVKADLKKFWFYYNFNPQTYTQADSYVGSVIAPDWMYALNSSYDPSSTLTEAGLNGKYLISQVDDYNDDLIAEAGRVFVNDYIDRDNGSEKHFTPYKYSQGIQPSGTSYLGSELDYIDASQSVTSQFGQDYYEADIVGGWFSQHVKDTGLQVKGDALFADGKIDRNDMITILKDAEDGSAVDSTEYSDLKTIVDSYSDLHMDDYVHILSNKIMKGDVANGRSGITELFNVIDTTNSVTQMDNLINKWFLGTYLPSTYIPATSETAAKTFNYSTQSAPGSLFGTDGQASYTDIQQGTILGDCYFLASLGAMALQRSSTISNMFIDNRDGTYTVRLFGVGQDGTASTTADYVTVNKILPANVSPGELFASYNGNSTVGLWVALAEKAYAQFAEEGTIQQETATDNYGSIEGGNGLYGMPSISGISAGCYSNVNYSGRKGSFLSLSDIASKLASGYAMTADTLSSSSRISSNGIVYDHEYIIVSADISAQTVTLYNPWGDNGLEGTGDNAGIKLISYSAFSRDFDSINVA